MQHNSRLNVFWLIVISFLLCSCRVDVDVKDVASERDNTKSCILIVPDIQNYIDDAELFVYLDSIVSYSKEIQEDIAVLLQTGDFTNNNQPWQWERSFEQFVSKLPNSFPFVYCLGNHDYGWNGYSDVRSSNCPAQMTPIMDGQMSGSKWENYFRYVVLRNKKIAVLSLEFAPRNEALDWANDVIAKNKDVPFIILTHAFLNNNGHLFDSTDSECDNNWSQKHYAMGGDYVNDSKEIFDKIVFNNPNVKLIVCGHCISNRFIECLEKKNVTGDSVYCIMVNYQHHPKGGAGFIGLLNYNNGFFNLKSFNTASKTYGNISVSFDINI